MTIQEMYAITPSADGWRRLPSGVYVKLGDYVMLGDGVTLGDYVTLGDFVTLGDYVKLGDGVMLGDGVKLGDYVTLGDYVKLGNDVTLGYGAKLGNGVTSLALAELYRQNYTSLAGEHIFWKWLCPNRKSPGWGEGTSIKYQPGAIIEADGETNDQQCAPGLHVFRIGERPEWHGLCCADHDLIAVRVRVRSEDILFAGLPTNDARLRVRRLEVLE